MKKYLIDGEFYTEEEFWKEFSWHVNNFVEDNLFQLLANECPEFDVFGVEFSVDDWYAGLSYDDQATINNELLRREYVKCKDDLIKSGYHVFKEYAIGFGRNFDYWFEIEEYSEEEVK